MVLQTSLTKSITNCPILRAQRYNSVENDNKLLGRLCQHKPAALHAFTQTDPKEGWDSIPFYSASKTLILNELLPELMTSRVASQHARIP